MGYQMKMMIHTLLALGIAVATADMTCPSTPAAVACGMKVTTTAAAPCAEVLVEMKARIAGQYGAWHDPHNNGTYKVENYGGTFSTSRLTGDGKYTDKQIFTLTDQSGSCLIEACSRSQVNSLFDKGTNYCDVKMLFCGSNDGCKPVKNDFSVGQETTSKFAQASVDMGACLKVSEAQAQVVPEIASPKAVPVGGDPDDCHDPLNPGACGCPCLVAHDCEVCGTFKFSAVCRDGTCQATGLDADAQTSLYKISGGECGQATLDSEYASYAEKFAGLTEGTCAAQGYTVGDGAQTLKVPVLGDITIAKFKKAEMLTVTLLKEVEPLAPTEKCCTDCVAPQVKYFSVDVPHGFCGETCIRPRSFGLFHLFEKNLTRATGNTPCREQFTPNGGHYTNYTSTVSHGGFGLKVTLDLYGPVPAK